jgi:hypothetical protein
VLALGRADVVNKTIDHPSNHRGLFISLFPLKKKKRRKEKKNAAQLEGA